MWKKIVLGILLAAIIGAAVYWFTYTKELHAPVSEAIRAIPTDAALIIESKQVENTWKKLAQTSVIWQELLGTAIFSNMDKQARWIDSLIHTDAAIKKLLDNRSLFVSAHVSGATTYDFLYVYSLPNLTYQSPLQAFLKKINNNIEPVYKTYAGVDIGMIYSSSPNNDSLSFAFSNGILILSKKQTLVEKSVRQLKSDESLLIDKNFSKVVNTAGKNVDANVYINYKNFPSILSRFISPDVKKDFNALPDFADCSGWDVAVKSNAFLLSGFTQAKDSTPKFLNLFRNQKPQEIELTKIIPSKTALLLFMGISNVKSFHREYKNYLSATQQLKLQSYERYAEGVNTKYGINIEHTMLEWMDSELALVVTEPASTDFSANSYAVVHSNNIEEASKSLTDLIEKINKKENPAEAIKSKGAKHKERAPTDENSIYPVGKGSEAYRNHTISYINIPQLLPQLFGWPFKKLTNTYFTVIDDYVVFGNTDKALENFINDFENNKVLVNDKNYKNFSENISTEANLYIYSSIARSPNIYSACIAEELAMDIEDKLDLLYKFEAIGLQFTINATNKLFYSNAYLKYNPNFKQESGTLWESKLDTTVSDAPHIVMNHNTKTKEVLIQDDANTLYLISNTGKVIWKRQLSEKIVSDVKQIDGLKNNKLQLIFNTRNAIYVLDRNGNDMRGFPIALEAEASNALSVFDYENNRDYRIFVACENKKLYCFKANGEEVTAFKFGKSSSLIRLPIQYCTIDNKDNLVAVDEKGKVYVFNRQGEERTKLKELVAPHLRSYYIEAGKDYSKSYLIAADSLGNIIKLSFAGDKEIKKIKRFDSNPYFDFKDINNDKIKEYIFVSANELTVFNQDQSVLFSYEFKEKISYAPLFFTLQNGETKIGVLSDKTNEMYLFDKNGTLNKGFPLAGKTLFCISDLNSDGVNHLITGSSDNSVYVYLLDVSPIQP
jgi:hypothetical protein